MAQVSLTVTVKMRWWVKPYLWAAYLYCWSVAPFIDEDDLDVFIDRQAHFIARFGISAVMI